MIDIARETSVFRREGISPSLSLLIPTFAFPGTPERLAPRLRRHGNAPLPMPTNWAFHGFGSGLMPDYYPRGAARLVSCYALFK